MNLEQLDAWLYTLEPTPLVNGASMLDGYLTAIMLDRSKRMCSVTTKPGRHGGY